MAQSVRVEFVDLGQGGSGAPANILVGSPRAAQTLTVTSAPTVAGSRPVVPTPPLDGYGQSIRLTAITNPVYVTWGTNPTASIANSVRLSTESPEILFLPAGQLLSFIAEAD